MRVASKLTSIRICTFVALAVVLTAGSALAQDEQMGQAPPAANEEPGTNEQLFDRTDMGNVAQAAMASYHAGHRKLVQARKMDAKLAETEPAKLEKARSKVEKAYQQAADSFLDAIRTNPSLFDAYTELGEAFRYLGKHAEAIQVHSKALELTPEDPANVYGRAESGDEHAGVLMSSLKRWVAEEREDPGEIRPDAVETLAAWIEQQESSSG
jgi:tetratricopeptide (TPR) repeat protein